MARKSTSKTKAKPKTRTNTQKGNPRKGRKFAETKNAKGQKVHRYRIKGKTVDVVMGPAAKKRSGKAKGQKRVAKGSAGGGRFSK